MRLHKKSHTHVILSPCRMNAFVNVQLRTPGEPQSVQLGNATTTVFAFCRPAEEGQERGDRLQQLLCCTLVAGLTVLCLARLGVVWRQALDGCVHMFRSDSARPRRLCQDRTGVGWNSVTLGTRSFVFFPPFSISLDLSVLVRPKYRLWLCSSVQVLCSQRQTDTSTHSAEFLVTPWKQLTKKRTLSWCLCKAFFLLTFFPCHHRSKQVRFPKVAFSSFF